jgi:hypothetical protein
LSDDMFLFTRELRLQTLPSIAVSRINDNIITLH